MLLVTHHLIRMNLLHPKNYAKGYHFLVFCYSQMQSGNYRSHVWPSILPLIARFMGPTWGLAGADRTQVRPILAPWTLLSGLVRQSQFGQLVSDASWNIFRNPWKKDNILHGKPLKEFDKHNTPNFTCPLWPHMWLVHLLIPCFGLTLVDYIHILQGCFTGTGAIIWLSQCKWSNPK